MLGDVEVVVDVAVEREALGLDGRDRLARELERDRLVQEPLARDAGRRRRRPGSRRAARRSRPPRHRGAPSGTCGPSRSTTWIPAARAARSAAVVRGRSTPSCHVSVRSRSHAIAATSRGKPSGSVQLRRLGDVRGDVGDFLLAEAVRERGHRALAVGDALDHESRDRAAPGRGSGRRCPTSRPPRACGSRRSPPTRRPSRRSRRRPSSVDVGCSAVVASGSVPTIVSGVGLTSSPPPHPARPAEKATDREQNGRATHRFRA